ncbi:hypothetical protein EYB53_024640 [Candidatus Chloroploca sp. M-50]|uniref:Uncharacterized protein n=1 Tax=Candidatus Chloroploca mongolica TaxID=2528176 RepID=A0ABS4DHL2_9CHLR|nr:hypothetical protein [Candidatus Chloroploca mongolica]MBP1468920.1 hypothetical protein [Candidatus Chloroploca mongolica]
MLGRTEGPRFAGQAFSGAMIDQGIEGVLDNRLGERAGRVVGAAGAAVGAAGDIEAACGDDDWTPKGVATQQPGEGPHPFDQIRIIVTGSPQGIEVAGVQRDRERLLQRTGGAAGHVAQEVDEGCWVLGLGSRVSGLGSRIWI